jgi:transposase
MSKKKKTINKNKNKNYSKEQKSDAVKYYLDSDDTLSCCAKNLGVAPSTLNGWIKQSEIDSGHGSAGALTTDEKVEIRGLKRELKQVKLENAFLKKAAVYFAKGTENLK